MSAGRFDVAQLVIDDMRRNVRKALFIDELDTRPNARTPLSATEVSERLLMLLVIWVLLLVECKKSSFSLW